MPSGGSGSLSAAPRWLADEMLGRLARYLRFLGHDTAYVRGLSDPEIAEMARADGRTLITRDRALAASTTPSLLLETPTLEDQLRAVRSAYPHAGWSVTFERCSLCNGQLVLWVPPTDEEWPTEIPRDLVMAGLQVHQCTACQQRYWEGSHTRGIRRQFDEWLTERKT